MQSKKTCISDSCNSPHLGQLRKVLIPRLAKFSFVGKAFRHDRHRKILILGGSFKFHKVVHQLEPPAEVDSKIGLFSLQARLYPLLTV